LRQIIKKAWVRKKLLQDGSKFLLSNIQYMKFFSLMFIMILCIHVQAASPLQPVAITCEYIENPLGIDMSSPRLSWNFTSNERNQFQSAYEIIVSDNMKDIGKAVGNSWSTGKISSSENIQIAYAGKPLQSFTRYYWRVKVYNQKGEASGWSNINWFETAMLSPGDWKAQWINDGSKNPARD
jgi:alpha-L-rhamnosidase